MFQQGAKDLAISNGVSQAADAVQALAADSSLTANQKIAQQQTFATQLQAQMAAAGAPAGQISAAVGALTPPKITNAQEALAAANVTDDPERKTALRNQAKDYTQLQADPSLIVANEQNKFTAKENALNRASDERKRAAAAENEFAKTPAAKREFDALPVENQASIKEIAGLMAKRTTIANQVESAVSGWPSLSPNEQLQQGKQLIKTLNSLQGSDAVGQEESKRLASKLQFAIGNFSNDNPTQFGRDLKGFYEDAKITSKFIRETISADGRTIDELYGRKPKEAAVNTAAAVSSRSDTAQKTRQQAIDWARANPKDPRADKLRFKYGF